MLRDELFTQVPAFHAMNCKFPELLQNGKGTDRLRGHRRKQNPLKRLINCQERTGVLNRQTSPERTSDLHNMRTVSSLRNFVLEFVFKWHFPLWD